MPFLHLQSHSRTLPTGSPKRTEEAEVEVGQIPLLPLISYVALSDITGRNLSDSQFPYLENGSNMIGYDS